MDSPVNVGHLHRVQTQNDTEARASRGIVIQKREAVDEVAQLVENMGGLEEDIVPLDVALAPHNDSLLPNEILSHIFIHLALDYGTVKFEIPVPNKDIPPQLVVSRVCSRWRSVALHTPELWSDTCLIFQTNKYHDHHIRFYHQWVSRAGTFPVTLSIMFWESFGNGNCHCKLAGALRNILLPIQVKRLSLNLSCEDLMALSTLSEDALSGLLEFNFELSFPLRDMNVDLNHLHPLITRLRPLITRLRSVSFLWGKSAWIDWLRPSIPWSQLRSLEFCHTNDAEDVIIRILRQTPMLEVLSFDIHCIGAWEQVTMPSLRTLCMVVTLAEEFNDMDVDNVLRTFMCPSITHLTLARDSWTCETFDILKRQYNMQKLREARFIGLLAHPVSFFLRGAPMLRSLVLPADATMDEEALIGISNGTLGQFLWNLAINLPYLNFGEVLDMMEARKKTVDGLIKNGCSWREEIVSLKDVVIYAKDEGHYKERITALKEAGISILFVHNS